MNGGRGGALGRSFRPIPVLNVTYERGITGE